MSYKAVEKLKERMEIDFIKSQTPEELNGIFNQLHRDKEKLQIALNGSVSREEIESLIQKVECQEWDEHLESGYRHAMNDIKHELKRLIRE